MIAPESVGDLMAIMALHNRPIHPVFEGTVQPSKLPVVVIGGNVVALEITDSRVIVRSIYQVDEDASLRSLYAEFEAEDRTWANAGLPDYRRMLDEIDGE